MHRQLALFELLVLAACARDRTITANVTDTASFRRAIASRVSPGMSLEMARTRLEREGFVCPQAEMVPGTPWYLYCRKQSGGRWAIVRRTYFVTATSADMFGVTPKRNFPPTVATVAVATGLVGP